MKREDPKRSRLYVDWIRSTYKFHPGRRCRLDWRRAGGGIVSISREGTNVVSLYFNPNGVENAAGLIEGLTVEIDGQAQPLKRLDRFASIDFRRSGAIWYRDKKNRRHLVVGMRIRGGLWKIRQSYLLGQLLEPEPAREMPQPTSLRQKALAKIGIVLIIVALAVTAGYILSWVGGLVVGPAVDRFFEAILPAFW